MTCAGLLGLAVSQGLSEDAKPLDDDAVKRALAMLAREIDRPNEKRPKNLYFLWSLERVGVLYDQPRIVDKDWDAWGSKALLPAQRADGGWQGGESPGSDPIGDTSF